MTIPLSIQQAAGLGALTLETCDYCGPTVRAAFIVRGRSGLLTFCAHCVNHGPAVRLAPFAVPIIPEKGDSQ